jgi:hypothetical protein
MVTFLMAVAGFGLLIYSAPLPVFTHPEAARHLANALEDLPREDRFKEWDSRLPAYKTSDVRFADRARGMLATTAGLLTAFVFFDFYLRWAWVRSAWAVFGLWLGAWAIRLPLTVWYYELRQRRSEYPWWGDTIIIPILNEWILWFLGAVVSSILLGLLLIRHPLPARLHLVRPQSVFGWVRAIILVLWIALLSFCVFEGISDGDEGLTFSCLAGSAVLLVFLSAPEIDHGEPQRSCGTRDATAPQG